MASSNVDTSTALTPDVYGINNYVNEIKKKFTPDVSEDTLLLGIFGYTGQMFSEMLQNSIVMASEFSNESIPTKAKFEKNIIAHALGVGITDINATPAQMDVLLTFIEDDIDRWANTVGYVNNTGNDSIVWQFKFDKDTEIYIGDYCYHTDYDILITKIALKNSGEKNKFAYTAKYIMGDIENPDNPISDITNPYLTAPVKMTVNGGVNVLFTKCKLHQVKKTTIYKTILSDNSIASKTFTFEFEGQLASFTMDVTEGGKKTHLVPVYEGLNVENKKYPHFYYTYLSSDTIRVKFDRTSYQPRINSDVAINIQTTEGEGGNFTFDPKTFPAYIFSSEKYDYSNIGCEIRPITGESTYGSDKKTIDDLKQLIPKEALSRGSITNLADLQNFFNMLNTDDSKLYFYKKRDNALERLYYSFILIRDEYNAIIPTNTLDIKVDPDELVTEAGSGKLIFERGKKIILPDSAEYAHVCVPGDTSDDDTDDGDTKHTGWMRCGCGCDCCKNSEYTQNFEYIIPYNLVINKNPLYSMYFMGTMDANKFLDFSYINEKCVYQFVATSINWHRGYLEDSNTYTMSISMEQNISSNDDDFKMIEEVINDDGTITRKVNVRCIAVFYKTEDDEEKPLRWVEGEYVDTNDNPNFFDFKFKFTTDDLINVKNEIKISGMNDIGATTVSDGYFASNTKCVIHVVSVQHSEVFDDESDDHLNAYNALNGLDKIVPNLTATSSKEEVIDENGIKHDKYVYKYFTLSNSYTVVEGVDFFYDYSEIVSSIVIYEKEYRKDADGNYILDEYGEKKEFPYYRIKGVPVVKADYFDSEDKVLYFCGELVKRKNYIDYVIQVLEDAFGMDFKFFNTYGPSKLFTLDNGEDYINRTNLSLTFRLKLKNNLLDNNVVTNIINDIKTYIENINEINSIHMSNLVADITKTYNESIVYFEFVDINGYGPSIQHVYSMPMPDAVITPEFLNISTLPDGTPDITILQN